MHIAEIALIWVLIDRAQNFGILYSSSTRPTNEKCGKVENAERLETTGNAEKGGKVEES